jgi:hypothetical protein
LQSGNLSTGQDDLLDGIASHCAGGPRSIRVQFTAPGGSDAARPLQLCPIKLDNSRPTLAKEMLGEASLARLKTASIIAIGEKLSPYRCFSDRVVES